MVDEKRRRFLKHLGFIGGAGILGLAVSQGSAWTAEALIDDLQETEQEIGYRIVWATRRDRDSNFGRPYSEYLADAKKLGIWECRHCNYIYDITDGREARFDDLPSDWICISCGDATKADFKEIGIAFRSGGQPFINEVACAYHFDTDGDGKYADEDQEVFCSMPCRTICPVDAITKGPFGTIVSEDDQPKVGPNVEFDVCIGCVRCHKICGYNSIEWINVPYLGSAARTQGGGN
jgi:rubredoxin/Pyruvate/2-oxoacid:ferredoxin oxidoreductase delta subunit